MLVDLAAIWKLSTASTGLEALTDEERSSVLWIPNWLKNEIAYGVHCISIGIVDAEFLEFGLQQKSIDPP